MRRRRGAIAGAERDLELEAGERGRERRRQAERVAAAEAEQDAPSGGMRRARREHVGADQGVLEAAQPRSGRRRPRRGGRRVDDQVGVRAGGAEVVEQRHAAPARLLLLDLGHLDGGAAIQQHDARLVGRLDARAASA